MWISFAPFPLWLEHLNLIWVIEMAGVMWLVFEENFPKAFLYIYCGVIVNRSSKDDLWVFIFEYYCELMV